MNDFVLRLLDSAQANSRFVLGRLALPAGSADEEGQTSFGVILVTQVLLSIIFFSAAIGILYYDGIVALLPAVVSLVALLNLVLSGIFGYTQQGMLGYLFAPRTVAMGVPPVDAMEMSRLVGERLVLTEAASYRDLAELMAGQTLHHPRSVVIAAYTLCGFAHLPSMAIFVEGIAGACFAGGETLLIGR